MSVRFASLVSAVLILQAGAGPSGSPAAQTATDPYAAVAAALGREGDFSDGVYRVGLPRTDLTVTVDGTVVPTALGFAGWIAFTRADHGLDVLMGDLVLTEDEVNPVISALLDRGFDVTALHNHFFRDVPRIFYLHVHGHGPAADLAARIRPALDLIGATRAPSAPSPAGRPLPATSLDPARLEAAVGHPGEQAGGVYKITIGRPDLDVRDMGARIGTRMGLNTWAAFAGSDGDAVVAGDVAMLEPEVTPVVRAMRRAGLQIVAIHHHMTGSRPVVIFLHYWGRGPAERLAAGVRAALDVLGKQGAVARQ